MKQALQIELIERARAHIAAKTTDTGEAGRIDVRSYTDPDRYAREVQALFRDTPQMVCHRSELVEPGSFVTRDVAGQPLLLARCEGGQLRGFLNVCRHRGAQVMSEPCGHATRFTCPYHAWSYGTDGSLRGVPHGSGFPKLDRSSRGLTRVPVTEHAGFVWVRPRPGDDPINGAAYLGPLGDDWRGFGLGDYEVFSRYTTRKAINWKLTFDIFLEAYHLRPTHGDSIFPMFFDNIGLVDHFEPHLRNVFPKRTIAALADDDRARWALREHANILYVIFPSTLVLIEPDHAGVLHVSPEGIDQTRIDSYMLIPEKPKTDKANRYWAANDEILRTAVQEDYAMGESIQRGFASGANESLQLGRFEHALAYFHASVTSAISR